MGKLTEFQNSIEKLANEKSDQILSIHGKEKSIDVISVIINKANNNVCIAICNFDKEIYDSPEIIVAINNLVKKKDVVVHVLFATLQNTTSKFIKILSDNNLDFEIIQDLDFFSSKFNNKQVNFITADMTMFHIETDIENHKSLCSFNKANTSQKLNEIVLNFFMVGVEKTG